MCYAWLHFLSEGPCKPFLLLTHLHCVFVAICGCVHSYFICTYLWTMLTHRRPQCGSNDCMLIYYLSITYATLHHKMIRVYRNIIFLLLFIFAPICSPNAETPLSESNSSLCLSPGFSEGTVKVQYLAGSSSWMHGLICFKQKAFFLYCITLYA